MKLLIAVGIWASFAVGRAQDLAPESIANSIRRVFYLTSPGNQPGPFSFVYSNNGCVYSVGLGDVAISRAGSYSWTKTGPNTGTHQSPAGISDGALFLTFTSRGAGTFRNISSTITGTFTFTPFELTEPTKIRNASSRITLTAGQPSMVGFVVSGTVPRRVLVRAIGPSLAGVGVVGAAPAPTLGVFWGVAPLATNTGWGGDANLAAAFTAVGAFSLPPASADSAVLLSLAPGAYTAQVRDATGGEVLLEVYFIN